MKLKLTAVQQHKIQTAYREASDVLREIKCKPLAGEALADMQLLEQSVMELEVFMLGKRR